MALGSRAACRNVRARMAVGMVVISTTMALQVHGRTFTSRFSQADQPVAQFVDSYVVINGTTELAIDGEIQEMFGIATFMSSNDMTWSAADTIEFAPAGDSTITFLNTDGQLNFRSAAVNHHEALIIAGPAGEVRLGGFALLIDFNGRQYSVTVRRQPHERSEILFNVYSGKLGFDAASGGIFFESAELAATAALAEALGAPRMAGRVIGSLRVRASTREPLAEAPGVDPSTEDEGGVAGGNNGTDCWNVGEPEIGPDVIVGVIDSLCNYDSLSGIEAFTIGTVSCNIGSTNLLWQAGPDPDHPVIGQNIFKYKNGRFEQIGQSWLKHGFAALTLDDCGCGCSGVGGSVLGVGCSDPYGCGLNGSQSGLGAKSEINPHLGTNLGSHDTTSGSSIYKRSQVAIADLEPSSASIRYFAEAHYIAADDAFAGNDDNNASHIAISMSGGGSVWNAALAGPTIREQAGIRAWRNLDPAVMETDVRVTNEGLLIVAAKATDLGTGFWRYEYAVQNLNSDRAVGSFSVPIDVATTAVNIGFHDVTYHSGEPYDGADWVGTPGSGMVSWSTTPYAMNPNANALRWGTLYNFRFDANRVPTTGSVTLGLFKPGSPASVPAMTVVPTSAPVSCTTNPECDDSLFCTGVEVCAAGFCQAGSNPCMNLCDETLNECVGCLTNFDCDDGLFCNGGETCSAGVCHPGANPCSIFCDETDDSCINCLNNAHCDDGLFCNGTETCAGGSCFAAGSGVLNGEFNGGANWTPDLTNGGSVTFPNNLNVIGADGGGAGAVWASQANVFVNGADLEFDLLSYSSSDVDQWDYPVILIDADFYGLDADGTIGPLSTCGFGQAGSINNGSPQTNVHFTIDIDAIAGPGSHTIGFGVCSVDGQFGAGTAVFDHVLPPLTPDDPCVGQCCSELSSDCVPCNVCGNGIVESPELCDDGDLDNCNGCTTGCTPSPIKGLPCSFDSDCRTDPANNACNRGACTPSTCSSVCTYSCIRFGDVKRPQDGLVNLDDTLCTLAGFGNFALCIDADIAPCGGNAIINLDDILVNLQAFAGANPCGCQPMGSVPLCGSIDP